MAIHPTAIVHPTAKIDPSVEIGPYAVIGEDTIIGSSCTVGPHAIVEFTHMGKNNRIMGGAFVGVPPQDLKYAGEKTRLVMGDNNTVRETATLNRGTTATGETRIGDNCLFMAYSHVAHDCRVGNHVILVNSVALAGHVEIGDYAVLGGLSAVHQFARIGSFVMVSGCTGVGKDVPPFCTAQGDRATLRGLNVVGLRRSGLPRETIAAIREAYKVLFLRGLTQAAALAELRRGNPPKEVLAMAAFIESSKRGVTRPAADAKAEEEVAA